LRSKLKKDELTRVFFHDIKNKLLTLKFNLYIIQNKPVDEEKKKEILEKLLITTEQTIDMVQDLLDSQKYTETKFLRYHTFPLEHLIREIIEELELDAQRKKVKVLFVCPHEHLMIKANREWLKKALFNILHNSIKYNKYEGRVAINIHQEKDGYLLVIKDTGVGISQEEKEKIFKKYYSSDKKNGSGIGLNMAKTFIEQHGGLILFESEKNRGSVFYIYLPKNMQISKFKQFFLRLFNRI